MIDKSEKLKDIANIDEDIDINVGVRSFPLPLINGFMPANMQFAGETTGNISIKGKELGKTQVDGFVMMQNGSLNYADLDAKIIFTKDSIQIRRNRVRFRDYNLLAANQNPVHLDGSLNFREELSNPELNLTLKGSQVQLINNKKRKNKMQYIYGNIPTNIEMSIKGNLSDLSVKGTLAALAGTNIDVFLEEDPLNGASKVEDLVEFVDFRQVDRIIPDDLDKPLRQTGKDEGLNLDLNFDIVQNAKVNVHLPTNKNDYVNLIGGGQLNLSTSSNGDIAMGGVYDINGGEVNYKLPVLPMTKTFELSNQSWLRWNGAIGSPTINLVAKEVVRTNVSNESGSRIVQFDVTAKI